MCYNRITHSYDVMLMMMENANLILLVVHLTMGVVFITKCFMIVSLTHLKIVLYFRHFAQLVALVYLRDA